MRAAQLAPDLYARSQRARQDAVRASDARVAADHAARAELLLDAAIAEADRIELDRKRAAAEARHGQLERERAQLERERVEALHGIQLEEAGRIARARAARVYQPRARGLAVPGPDQAQPKPDEFCLDRAELTLAAALALGADATEGAALRAAIERVRRQPTGGRGRLAAAEQVLARAERALGAARLARGAPSPLEPASLLEAGRERGLTLERQERGVLISLEGVFGGEARAPGGVLEPTVLGRRLLAHVAALLRVHPHGSVQLELPGRRRRSPRATASPAPMVARLRGLLELPEVRSLELLPPAAATRPQLILPAYASPK